MLKVTEYMLNTNVGDSSTEYTLTIAGYSGTAGDSMTGDHNLNGQKFSTKDNDNDNWDNVNCAAYLQGAWWHKVCTHSNLNGPYGTSNKFMFWYHWKNSYVPLKFSELNRY